MLCLLLLLLLLLAKMLRGGLLVLLLLPVLCMRVRHLLRMLLLTRVLGLMVLPMGLARQLWLGLWVAGVAWEGCLPH